MRGKIRLDRPHRDHRADQDVAGEMEGRPPVLLQREAEEEADRRRDRDEPDSHPVAEDGDGKCGPDQHEA
jgi:hypothetical protein